MPVFRRPDAIEGEPAPNRGVGGGNLLGGSINQKALEAIEVVGVAKEAIARAWEGETEDGKEFGCKKGKGRAAEQEIGETQIEKRTYEGG